jgi:hypothetical protein
VRILRLGNLINSLRKHGQNLPKARLVNCEVLTSSRVLDAVLGASC